VSAFGGPPASDLSIVCGPVRLVSRLAKPLHPPTGVSSGSGTPFRSRITTRPTKGLNLALGRGTISPSGASSTCRGELHPSAIHRLSWSPLRRIRRPHISPHVLGDIARTRLQRWVLSVQRPTRLLGQRTLGWDHFYPRMATSLIGTSEDSGCWHASFPRRHCVTFADP